ncbi:MULTISPECIES: hypothetical protein [Rhodopirellula]|jgi:hypothetical protein|uniref:Putative membrane protein n=1 Tax=Rhodopirellula europaea SH398 TaxID=1263868 RepID=M5SC98_9BACT|nr:MULTISPECIES: hypothetical protein [Rhodopirellula]EMI23754.1 putative membrane protein [Rhodopirellula europaea SH398]MCR9211582.1 hypothetical protein [bacterium]
MSDPNSTPPATSDPPSNVFHDGLAAAVMARVPIHLGSGGSVDGLLTLEKVELLKRQPAAEWPPRYRAAREVFDRTGNMQIVLDGLTHDTRSEKKLSRLLWGSCIYLMTLAVIGYLGLTFFTYFIGPSVNALRADMQLVPSTPQAPHSDPIVDFLPSVLAVAPFVLLGTCLLIWITGGVSRWAARLGGSAFIRDNASAVAMRLIAAMAKTNVPAEEAVNLSCDLLDSRPDTRNQVQTTLRGRVLNASSETTLLRLGTHFKTSASNRMSVLKVVLPIVLTALIGGTGVMAYSFALFNPLVSLIHDLSMPTRDLPAGNLPKTLAPTPPAAPQPIARETNDPNEAGSFVGAVSPRHTNELAIELPGTELPGSQREQGDRLMDFQVRRPQRANTQVAEAFVQPGVTS